MFLNRAGQFKEVTLTSGVDFTEDGRGFAVTDFDNDGLLDLGIVSSQKPRFRIARMGEVGDRNQAAKRFVSVRLLGGNRFATPNGELSPRDSVGAILLAKSGPMTRMFQLSRGEGFSVQNSSTVHIGLGEHSQIDELEIRWPSGKITVETDILAGTKIEISETGN